jgi:hypothetical protein
MTLGGLLRNRIIWSLLTIAVALIAVYAVIRDIRFEEGYTGDLRSRIVGARIVKDGGSPYFYKWRPGDGLRYYDPENFNRAAGSNITSTPMFCHLLYPLAEWPQATISRVWLGIEYGMLIALTAFALSRAPTVAGKWAVLVVMGLVLLSDAWKCQVTLGQVYLWIPFFAMLFLLFGEKNDNPAGAFFAGVAASCLVLIRFNTVLFFLPFLFLFYRYSRRSLLWFGFPVLLFAGWVLGSTHERGLWQDYYRYVMHAFPTQQGLLVDDVSHAPDPRYPLWEGIDTMVSHRYQLDPPARIYSENGNAFVIYEKILHRKMPIILMTALSVLLITVCFLFYYRRARPLKRPDVFRAALVGFVLLMIPDIFSPVYRHQYYTIQWVLPLLLAAGRINARQKVYYSLLLIGLLFNCFHLPFLKMQNTIGEYLFLLVLLLMAADPASVDDGNPRPVGVSSNR